MKLWFFASNWDVVHVRFFVQRIQLRGDCGRRRKSWWNARNSEDVAEDLWRGPYCKFFLLLCEYLQYGLGMKPAGKIIERCALIPWHSNGMHYNNLKSNIISHGLVWSPNYSLFWGLQLLRPRAAKLGLGQHYFHPLPCSKPFSLIWWNGQKMFVRCVDICTSFAL